MVSILKLFQPDSHELYRLRSIAEAAAILGCTPKAVYAYSDATSRAAVGKHYLETCMVGGRRKTSLDCIQRFLKQEEPEQLPDFTLEQNGIDIESHKRAVALLATL